MRYQTAMSYAEQIVVWLTPFCERMEVCGSVRRRKMECGDIDLVVIPKLTHQSDLLGAAVDGRNLLKDELVRYVEKNRSRGAGWMQGEGGVTTGATVNFLLKLVKCQLDVFCATEENFGALVLTRTGSKEHNIWMAMEAERLGLRWSATRGVRKEGVWYGRSEEEIFRVMGMGWVKPELREK